MVLEGGKGRENVQRQVEFFIEFPTKNYFKKKKKRSRSNNGRRNSKNASLLTHISAKNARLGASWLALAGQSGPPDERDFFETCCLKGSPEGPKVLHGPTFETILSSF